MPHSGSGSRVPAAVRATHRALELDVAHNALVLDWTAADAGCVALPASFSRPSRFCSGSRGWHGILGERVCLTDDCLVSPSHAAGDD